MASGFHTEHELQRVVQRCHNVLWERHGLDPAQAFDEFSKLLFVKLFDEVRSRGESTSLQFGDRPKGFADRVRALFAEANESPGFSGIFPEDEVRADDVAVWEVFRQLANHSLLQTASLAGAADVKGTIYERIVGNTFRGELGQFFTHRNIVEFMVRFVQPTEGEIVYDPACGSGGFLIMCAKAVRELLGAADPKAGARELDERVRAYSRRCLVGTEINERTVRVAKLNLLMHGLDHGNIFLVNALKTEECLDRRLHGLVSEGSVDIVLANPPFAGYEKDPNVLAKFDLGRNGNGLPSAVTREVLFLERIMRLLRDGGRCGIVIPQGVFTNRSLARVRDYVRQQSRILGVVELPDWAFIPSGTSVRGSLLFLRRAARPPRTYSVFMKRVEAIGFTSTGRRIAESDFAVSLEEYRARDARFRVPVTGIEDRLDAKFYLRQHREVIGLFQENPRHRLVRLAEIGSFDTRRANPRLTPDSDVSVIETGSVDPDTLTISPKRMKGGESNYSSLRLVREGDILISRRRAYRGAVVIVAAEFDGCLAIPEFSVLRLREGYSRDYVAEVLRSEQFVRLMTVYSTGEMSGRISEKDLRNLRIPVVENQADLARRFAAGRKRIQDLRSAVAEERAGIAGLCAAIIEGS